MICSRFRDLISWSQDHFWTSKTISGGGGRPTFALVYETIATGVCNPQKKKNIVSHEPISGFLTTVEIMSIWQQNPRYGLVRFEATNQLTKLLIT